MVYVPFYYANDLTEEVKNECPTNPNKIKEQSSGPSVSVEDPFQDPLHVPNFIDNEIYRGQGEPKLTGGCVQSSILLQTYSGMTRRYFWSHLGPLSAFSCGISNTDIQTTDPKPEDKRSQTCTLILAARSSHSVISIGNTPELVQHCH